MAKFTCHVCKSVKNISSKTFPYHKTSTCCATCQLIQGVGIRYNLKFIDAAALLHRKSVLKCECCKRNVENEAQMCIEYDNQSKKVRGVTCKSCDVIIGKIETGILKDENYHLPKTAKAHHIEWILRNIKK